jgi:hypothetical protein
MRCDAAGYCCQDVRLNRKNETNDRLGNRRRYITGVCNTCQASAMINEKQS